MNERYTVEALVTLKFDGVARIVDENGKILREHNLGDVPAYQVPLQVDLPCPPVVEGVKAKCGVQFKLEDIFMPWNT